jgi:hypothetical protein
VRGEYAALFESEPVKGWKSMVIAGNSTLAEIAAICAMERAVRIIAIVDPDSQEASVMGFPVCRDFAAVPDAFDGAVIADLRNPAATRARAEAALGASRTAIPPFLRVSQGAGA